MRKKTRLEYETRIKIKFKGDETSYIEGNTKNISFNGVYVETDARPEISSLCNLEINLPGVSSRLVLNIKGVVVRHGDNGVGISYYSMDPETFMHLKNLLIYNSSDPDSMKQEIG